MIFYSLSSIKTKLTTTMKNIKKILTVVFFALLLTTVYSQPYTIWQKQYAGSSGLSDEAMGISANSNGEVFVTGYTTDPNADIVTIKYDPATGDSLWVKRYSGSLEDKPTSITSDNNFVYVTGWSFSSVGGRDIITIKYSAATGDTVYVKKYNGTGNGGDYGWAIEVDAAGNAYVTGRTDIGGQQKMLVLKYDPSGNISYSTVYIGPLSNSFDEAKVIKVDASGNAFIAGLSGVSNVPSTYDYLTMKLNANGIIQWAKKYNGTANAEDYANSMVIDNSETNIFVGGSSFRTGTLQDYFIIKYNAITGDSVASAYYSAAANIDVLKAMTKDNSGNIYVTGNSFGTTNYNFATIKYNSSLQQQWVTRTTNSGPDYSVAVDYDPSGFVYVSGYSTGSGTGTDYLTERYFESNGARDWFVRNNGGSSGNDIVTGMVVIGPDNIYVTGSAVFEGNLNFYTIRYSQTNSVRPVSGEVPKSFNLEQNYPNPFNPSTKFNFDLPENTHVNIVVYDMLGREVEMLVNNEMKAGKYEVTWNAVNSGSGVYFYKLTTASYTETKKMILQK
jgi:hypothetical protein